MGRVGAGGSTAAQPASTVCASTAEPPLESNTTVYDVAGAEAPHLAWRVRLDLTVELKS